MGRKQNVCEDPWEVFDFKDYEQYYDIVQEEIVNELYNENGD